MDRWIAAVSRAPSWLLKAALAAVLIASFPRKVEARELFGLIPLDTHLTLWAGRVTVVFLLVGIALIVFFAMRSVLAFLEEGRWPTKAAGLTMESLEGAAEQVERDADDLSDAAERSKYFERQLKLANQTIKLLRGELERVRGSATRSAPNEEYGIGGNGV